MGIIEGYFGGCLLHPFLEVTEGCISTNKEVNQEWESVGFRKKEKDKVDSSESNEEMKKPRLRDFPGPVVKNSYFHAGDTGSIPGQKN